SISVKGKTSVSTSTDGQGKYHLLLSEPSILIFSYMGYATSELPVDRSGVFNMAMETSVNMLDEVVAIGYGTVRRSDLTGAVASIKAEDLKKTPAANLDQALQGRAAGVTVNANSGQPGAPAVVRIRGIGTVNDSSPIYVVDGVILSDISFLSPNDIETTEILKDASATAIYGSRGANGVILVTTKKGRSGRTNISFDSYFGVQNRWNQLDLMKSREFAEKIIELDGV